MIILVDMTVTMGVDLVILMRDLMVDTWAVQVLAIKVVCICFTMFLSLFIFLNNLAVGYVFYALVGLLLYLGQLF